MDNKKLVDIQVLNKTRHKGGNQQKLKYFQYFIIYIIPIYFSCAHLYICIFYIYYII